MKNLILVLSLLSATVMTAQGTATIEAVTRALSAGDVDALARHLADNVDLSILEQEQSSPKSRAIEQLRSFFQNNRPRSFHPVHQGTSRGSSDQYCIGNLSTSSGTFRVYVYVKVAGTGAVVQELRFDRD
jgi:cell division protein FtsL